MASVPAGWGTDELAKFIAMARGNLLASYDRLRKEYSLLRQIDDEFLHFFAEMADPENVSAAMLALRAHSAFRAAAQLVLAGQHPEAYMVMRGCLEHALYANHICAAPNAGEVWRDRDKGEAERKKCVKEFSGRNLFGSLRARDLRLGDIAGELYERTIDMGAHPNEMAIGATVALKEREKDLHIGLNYLAGDGLPMRLALKSLGQTGVIVLDILCLVLPKQASARGMQARLGPIKKYF